MRSDLDLTTGQLCAQAGHATKTALYRATLGNPELAAQYMGDSYGTNIILHTRSLHYLLHAYEEAKQAGLYCALIEESMYPVPGEKTPIGLGIFGTKNQTKKILKRFNFL